MLRLAECCGTCQYSRFPGASNLGNCDVDCEPRPPKKEYKPEPGNYQYKKDLAKYNAWVNWRRGNNPVKTHKQFICDRYEAGKKKARDAKRLLGELNGK